MRYRIERLERAGFSAPVREHHFECRIVPWDDGGQRLHGVEIATEPAAELASHRDGFGNQVHRGALLGAHDRLVVRLQAEVETLLANPFDFEAVAPAREAGWIADSLRQAPRLWDFLLHRSPLTPALEAGALGEPDDDDANGDVPSLPLWQPGVAILRQMQDACHQIGEDFTLDRDEAPAAALTELFLRRSGGAADLAHLLIAIARSWGVPARFVTGYLDAGYFEPDEDDPDDSEPRPQALHCWMEALVPGAGWRGFDPSNDLVADDTFIRLAVGRDLRDVIGFRQSFKGEGRAAELDSEIDVRRLD